MQDIQIPRTITSKDIEEKGFLSPNCYKYIVLEKQKQALQTKCDNLLGCFRHLDGFAFRSQDFVPEYLKVEKIPVVRIGNINGVNYLIKKTEDYECLPISFKRVYERFLLEVDDVCVSLTGGNDYTINIAKKLGYKFDILLNQRVTRLRLKEGFPRELCNFCLASVNHIFFKTQWFGYGGVQKNTVATQRDTAFLPKIENSDLIKYVDILVEAIIRKEAKIEGNYNSIVGLLDKELKINQQSNQFNYNFPTIEELQITKRLDAGIYSQELKRQLFYIENYLNGFKTLRELNFISRRGPNLAVSVIGRSIYSEEPRSNFYQLIEPMDITACMTINRFRWFGNVTTIPTLKKGDILFGAEGSVGKVYIFCESPNKTITNYHGMSINKDNFDLSDNIFVGCFLSYLRRQGVLDIFSIGGQGGSVGKEAILELKIPNFPKYKKEVVAKYYHNPINYMVDKLNLANFEEEDIGITKRSGILQLDRQIKAIKQKLEDTVNTIITDEQVQMSFNF